MISRSPRISSLTRYLVSELRFSAASLLPIAAGTGVSAFSDKFLSHRPISRRASPPHDALVQIKRLHGLMFEFGAGPLFRRRLLQLHVCKTANRELGLFRCPAIV